MLDIPSINIVFQDEFIVVIDKPAGVLSVPGGFSPGVNTVQSILQPTLGRLWMVHRLDKDTSGIMVLARSADAHKNLNLQFDQRLVQKEYLALVYGEIAWDSFVVSSPLLVNGDRNHRTIVSARTGKPAISNLTLLAKYQRFSLVAIAPKTGLTHQIRAHLASINHPILMDSLYSRKSLLAPYENDLTYNKISALINRTALHAHQITFTHPSTQTELSLKVPVSEDIKNVISLLEGMR